MLGDFPDRLNWIDKLGTIPSRCIERVDMVHGGKSIFHGCYDWHSSVHGHWAIFRMDLAGTGRYHELAVKAAKRFTEDKINSVIKELKNEPAFEIPYGRAWLLRLAVEFENWSRIKGVELPLNWRMLSDYVADSLLGYYLEGPERAPNIYSNQYRNDSFSLVQLHDYFQHQRADKLDQVLGYVSKHFLNKQLVFDTKLESDPNAFLSPFWSWVYLLAKTQPTENLLELVKVNEIKEELSKPAIQRDTDPKKVHHYGINWSRAWAIKSLAKRMSTNNSLHSKRLITAYQEHINKGITAHEEYCKLHPDIEEKDAYNSYYHWVPQFGVYAITDL